MRSRTIRPLVMLAIVFAFIMGSTVAKPAKADSSDGRINLIPWGNSLGFIAVYCVDQFDHPQASFTGGGIKILTSNGQKVFFAPQLTIDPLRVKANETGQTLLIWTQGNYSLYAQPGGYFLLLSKPDAEGKTFISRWQDCLQVGPGPDPAVPSQTTTTVCIDGLDFVAKIQVQEIPLCCELEKDGCLS